MASGAPRAGSDKRFDTGGAIADRWRGPTTGRDEPMRITCPKCGATYEIDADLIPPGGRDVQCAECEHAWTQAREGRAAPAEPEAAPVEPEAEPAEPEAEPRIETAAEPEAPRRRHDEETLRILREEAARAAAQRKARRERGAAPEPEPAETPAPEPRSPRPGGAPVPARPDRDETPHPAPAARPAPTRRGATGDHPRPAEAGGDLLPDIDEVNSTLSGPPQRRHPAPRPAPRRRGRRWRTGLALALLVLAALAALYIAAPWMTARV